MSTHRHPKIIKRYQNRKLYDTSDSCYVTLEDISEMIKQGEEVEIIDNTTKEDISAVTLAQIIFEEQKKKKHVLPLGTFRQIIQGSGEALRDLVSRGAREIGHVKEFVDDKVKPAVSGLHDLLAFKNEMDAVSGLHDLLAFKNEMDGLRKRIETLEQQVGELGRR
jgi:polyhydroxyalkanoate synthesis repressor PhaR